MDLPWGTWFLPPLEAEEWSTTSEHWQSVLPSEGEHVLVQHGKDHTLLYSSKGTSEDQQENNTNLINQPLNLHNKQVPTKQQQSELY